MNHKPNIHLNVHYVKDLMKKGLMTKEFYTMEENKAKEGLVNGSWGIVSDLHNYVTENQSMKYVPLGPLNTVKGKFRVEKPYKSGANGWLYQVRLNILKTSLNSLISLQVAEVNYSVSTVLKDVTIR